MVILPLPFNVFWDISIERTNADDMDFDIVCDAFGFGLVVYLHL